MSHDYFSNVLTDNAMYFEIVLFIYLVGILFYGISNYKFFIWRFIALFIGIFAFEGLTGALWINSDLGSYAYIHNDISWVMTLLWSGLIIGCKFLYDKISNINSKYYILHEFIFVTVLGSILGLLLLIYLKSIGVFAYSVEMQKIVESGITVLGRPLEAIIYFPIFVFSTFSFYKYWELAMYNNKIFDGYKINIKKDIFIAGIIISLIGYILHPILLVSNIYIYILLLICFIFNLIITSFTISKFVELPLFMRFIAATFIFTVIGSIITSLFVGFGGLEFSKSILDTHTLKTFEIPFLNISDVELGGILFFGYFIIATVKYLKIITDNKDIKLDDKNMTFKGFKNLLIKQK